MGLPVEVNNLMMGAVGGYQISRSLRFRSSASAYLNRTFGTPTNGTKWTWSGWVKRGILGATDQKIFMAYTGSNNRTFFSFNNSPSDTFAFYQYTSGTYPILLSTGVPVLRDPSAWYHVVLSYDSTQTTASNRAIIYFNNQVYSWSGSPTYPSLNYVSDINTATPHGIARDIFNNGSNFDGYLAEVNFIDGQALTPSSFGETDSITGVWNPKKYSGTYGTNGFYLNFSDNSGATATTIGKDSSGNGNNWTPNNISVTAGTTYDSMTDVPTLTSATAANFCTLNPLKRGTTYAPTISNGNLQLASATATQNPASSTIGAFTGKWYFEAVVTNLAYLPGIGVCDPSINFGTGDNWRTYNLGVILYSNGTLFTNASSTSSGYTYAVNDVIGVAFDSDTGKVWIAKNNTWFNSGNPSAGTGQVATATGYASLAPVFDGTTVGTNDTIVCNFGQRPFSYTPPSGYNALNTYNLPPASISNGAKHFAAKLWTGTNTNGGNSITGVGFSPDFVWSKVRSQGYSHLLYDRVRGVGNNSELQTDGTSAEGGTTADQRGYLSSLDADGFSSSIGSLGDNLYFNQLNQTYVAWCWKGGGTAVTNNSGTISSQVSANTSAGFSIATFTTPSTFTNATVGHGLGVAPSMIIVKSTTNTGDWITWHTSLGTNGYVILNSTSASGSNSGAFNGTSSTTWTMGSNTWWQASARSWVAYCFSAVRGFSAFGSYTGNGSTDGPMIYTGFRPRWLLIKRSSSTSDWILHDTSRSPYNLTTTAQTLAPNISDAEGSVSFANDDFDMLSNGFKMRNIGGAINLNGDTYIYAAFAENPFNYSRAR